MEAGTKEPASSLCPHQELSMHVSHVTPDFVTVYEYRRLYVGYTFVPLKYRTGSRLNDLLKRLKVSRPEELGYVITPPRHGQVLWKLNPRVQMDTFDIAKIRHAIFMATVPVPDCDCLLPREFDAEEIVAIKELMLGGLS
jgi:hypothetical protein